MAQVSLKTLDSIASALEERLGEAERRMNVQPGELLEWIPDAA